MTTEEENKPSYNALEIKIEEQKKAAEDFRLRFNKVILERDNYKMKWEIECERFNDLMEKIVDKVGR